MKHVIHEVKLFYIVSEKILFKYGMFQNEIVQYKRTVTNSFKQGMASPASVRKYYVIENGSRYQPPYVAAAYWEALEPAKDEYFH